MQLRPDVSDGVVKLTKTGDTNCDTSESPELSEVLKWLIVELTSGKRTFNSRQIETTIAKSTAVICCRRRLRRRPSVIRRLELFSPTIGHRAAAAVPLRCSIILPLL